MKYWHEEMTQKEYDKWVASDATWGDVMERYKQPDWCDYPGALMGAMGCWSLLGRRIKSIADCGDCECKKYKGTLSAE